MPFLSWFEVQFEQAKSTGEVEGLHKGILSLLKVRFGAEGEALAAEARNQADPDWLQRFLAASETASLVELRKLLP